MTNAFARRLSAEAVGTMILTLFGGAAVIAASLSGFAANLLGPLAFGFALLTGINILGPISGAHFNPAVTVALAIRGRFPWSDVAGYVVAQCVGAIVAGLLLFFTFGNSGVKAGLATTSLRIRLCTASTSLAVRAGRGARHVPAVLHGASR